MAKFNGRYLKGAVGPVIFKRYGNRQIVVSKMRPGTMKQTDATKKCSGTFGMSSSLGAYLRNNVDYYLNGRTDSHMASRLTGALNKSLQLCLDKQTMLFSFDEHSFGYVAGFDFNKKSPLKKNLNLIPEIRLVNGGLMVSFPTSAFSSPIAFPKESTSCTLMLSVSLVQLADGKIAQTPDKHVVQITKVSNELSGKEFAFTVPNGCLCVVTLFLQYYKLGFLINNKDFSPAGICGTLITQGAFEDSTGCYWNDMPGLRFNC